MFHLQILTILVVHSPWLCRAGPPYYTTTTIKAMVTSFEYPTALECEIRKRPSTTTDPSPPFVYGPGVDPTSWHYFDLIEECGQHITSTNLNSTSTTIASIGQLPWIVKLVYVSPSSTPKDIKLISTCGGVLITTVFVLTAKHCIIDGLMGARLGDYHAMSEIYCIGDLCADAPQSILMQRTVKHPDYNIAIVVLKEAAKYTPYVRPICLPWNNTVITADVGLGEVAGWQSVDPDTGRRKFTPLHTHLMSHISKQSCQNTLGVTLNSTEFCAGGYFDQDICKGVDGGPLMKYTTINGARKYYVVGISSFGGPICDASKPIGYTNITAVLRWILFNLDPVTGKPKKLFEHYFS